LAFLLPIRAWCQSLNIIPSGNFYADSSLVVELNCDNSQIFYTTNGSTPGKSSKPYKKAFVIKKTTVVRAVAYQNNKRIAIISRTYFINEPKTTLPIVSVAVSPYLLFNPKTGLFREGPRADKSQWKRPGANYWSKKEILCQVELFDTSQNQVLNQFAGFRVFGGMSRTFPQKSFALSARERYGDKHFKYSVFGKNEPKKFKHLVLRNGGSDWGKSFFRDELMTSLVQDWDIDIQANQPAHVYLNGKYWGLYNIREKINRDYLASHHGVRKDKIDLIQHQKELRHGSLFYYSSMMRFISKNNLSSDAKMRQLEQMMDIDNFMNYQIAEIYCDNQDAGGNIKYWRPHEAGGKWRWILYDTDFGFGLHNPDAYRINTLALHTDPKGPSWPNPPWSTLILRKLLDNESFKRLFITRFCDHLNDSFSAEVVLDAISERAKLLEPEMSKQQSRWKLEPKIWFEQLDVLKDFAKYRPLFMRQFLAEQFQLSEPVMLQLSQNLGGNLMVNQTIKVTKESWQGYYFQGLAISIKALPKMGFVFDHWEVNGELVTDEQLAFVMKKKIERIIAIFRKVYNEAHGKIKITEVSNSDSHSGDWIEIANFSNQSILLSSYTIADTKHQYPMPTVTLDPGEYLVICQDIAKFKNYHPDVYNVIGSFRFGLSKAKDEVHLYAGDRSLIDEMQYAFTPGDTLTTLVGLWSSDSSFSFIRKEGKGSPGSGEVLTAKTLDFWTEKQYYFIAGMISLLLIYGVWKVYLVGGTKRM